MMVLHVPDIQGLVMHVSDSQIILKLLKSNLFPNINNLLARLFVLEVDY